MLFIYGTADRRAPPAEGRLLCAGAGDMGELWIIEGAAHEDLHAFAGAEYERRIIGFLDTHLTRSK